VQTSTGAANRPFHAHSLRGLDKDPSRDKTNSGKFSVTFSSRLQGVEYGQRRTRIPRVIPRSETPAVIKRLQNKEVFSCTRKSEFIGKDWLEKLSNWSALKRG